jgi:hypothetical protein
MLLELFVEVRPAERGRSRVVAKPPTRISAFGVRYWEHEEDGDTDWETGWAILPEHEGKGLATAAIAEVVKAAAAEGSRKTLRSKAQVSDLTWAFCAPAGTPMEPDLRRIAAFEDPEVALGPLHQAHHVSPLPLQPTRAGWRRHPAPRSARSSDPCVGRH